MVFKGPGFCLTNKHQELKKIFFEVLGIRMSFLAQNVHFAELYLP